MVTTLATLNGSTVLACSVRLPAWGIWWADVELDSDEQMAGAVTLELAGLTLVGTIISGGPWHGRARYRIAGGAGQWGKWIGPQGYANDAGVKRAGVAGDAATACGETVDLPGLTGTLGGAWTREAGPASRTLELVAPRAWYVAEDGITRFGRRPAVPYAGEAAILLVDEAAARVVLGADELAGLIPGAVVDGIEAVDVLHELADGTLRTTLWGDRGASSRTGTAFARIVLALTAELRYSGLHSYRVVSQNGERLDLQVERASSGLPNLQRVRVRYGVPGATVEHTLGALVLVAFVDGDPARPVVVAGDDPDAPGFVPAEIHLATANAPVVRYGETVTVGAAAGPIVFVAGGAAVPVVPGMSQVLA